VNLMDVLMKFSMELEQRVFFICKNVFRKSHLDILYSLSRVMFSMLESRSISSKHMTIGYQWSTFQFCYLLNLGYSSYTSLNPEILPSLCTRKPSGTADSPPGSTFELLVRKVPSCSLPGILSNSSLPSL
jgi:hypothetical protein